METNGDPDALEGGIELATGVASSAAYRGTLDTLFAVVRDKFPVTLGHVADPRGGVRWVIPEKATNWRHFAKKSSVTIERLLTGGR